MSAAPSYDFYPPPPKGGGGRGSAFSPAVVAIIAVLGSAFLVVSYYRIFAKLCTKWQNRRGDLDMEGQFHGAEVDVNSSPLPHHGLNEVLIKKISKFEYKSGDGFTVETDCPVCLMEFSDNQELRMLPKCAHAFHVACIDTWLTSHSTCPICRSNIFPDHVISQYPAPAQVDVYGTPAYTPEDAGVEFPNGDMSRFNGGSHGRAAAPTLRGLLNYEDMHEHANWIPGSSGRGDPGEDSIRLYDSRDHSGDSASRHHHIVVIPAESGSTNPDPSIDENPDAGTGPYFSPDTRPQAPLTRTESFKEPHSLSRDRDHKWRIPARRPSFRKNPFSIVRSYSMGTSRRLVHALEFLDLEDLRGSQSKGGDKLYRPHEYGITETPDYPTNLSISTPDVLSSERRKSASASTTRELEIGIGLSSELKDFDRSSSNLGNSSRLDLLGAAIKNSGTGKGRSLSFRSPFSLKRSLSSGRHKFSFRQTSKGRISPSSSDSQSHHPAT